MRSRIKQQHFHFPNAPLALNLERTGLILALLIIAAAFMGSWVSSGGSFLAPAQRDPLFFLQYARMIADGEWLVYMPGDAVSTGCTSVLYPFLLSIPLMVCKTPNQMMAASFFLNAVLFLGAVYFSIRNARRYFASREGYGLAFVLLLLTQPAFLYAALGQTDVVLFTLVTQWMLWAMLKGRGGLLIALAALAPWCRPEGAVLGIAALMTSLYLPYLGSKPRLPFRTAGLAAVASTVLLLLLNAWLTGDLQFQSMGQKGHFSQFTVMGGIAATAHDLVKMLRELFFGTGMTYRSFFLLPVIPFLLMIMGVWSAHGNHRHRASQTMWALAAVGAFILVASSGWEGFVLDRHIGWLWPFLVLWMVMGLKSLASAAEGRRWLLPLLSLLLVYQTLGTVFVGTVYAESCCRVAAEIEMAGQLNEALEPGSVIGCTGNSFEMALVLNKHRLVNVQGIGSPDFYVKNNSYAYVEKLKHNPALRFDYWYSEETNLLHPSVQPLLGDFLFAASPNQHPRATHSLYGTNWSALDAALEDWPITVEPGFVVQAELDVGYGPHETAAEYQRLSEPGHLVKQPVFMAAANPSGEQVLMESGTWVGGMESFSLRTVEGQPARLALRTARQVTLDLQSYRTELSGQSRQLILPVHLPLVVNGQPLAPRESSIHDDGFSYVEWDIPAEAITGETTAFLVIGAHASFAYRLYQFTESEGARGDR